MLYYLGNAVLPGKMAHSIQEMRMCEAFSEVGMDVVYLHSQGFDRKPPSWEAVADHYGLESEFEIRTFRTPQHFLEMFPKTETIFKTTLQTFYLLNKVALGRISDEDIIYGRNYYLMCLVVQLFRLLPSRCRPTIIFELHGELNKRFLTEFFNRIDGVVCITESVAEFAVHEYQIDRDRIFVAPDGVNPEPYGELTKTDARDNLGWSRDEDIIVYTGHLYEGKGVETLVTAADELETTVYVVGGWDEDIERVKSEVGTPDNLFYVGFVEPERIPVYQVAADVLVAPYSEDSHEFISPLKLFEYMAAGRPIVASDRDVLQEVLTNGNNALLFDAGNPEALAECLREILIDNKKATDLARTARRSVDEYTWTRRAERILEAIGH